MGTSEVGLNAFYISIWLQAYGGQEMKFGGLRENGPHRLIESGTIMSCGLIYVALLEEMCL